MSSALVKADVSDIKGGYLADKIISQNSSITIAVVDPLGDGNKALDLSASVGPYKVYSALMFQEDVADPMVTELANTLGVTMTWARMAAGVYEGTANNPIFNQNQTLLLIQEQSDDGTDTASPEITLIKWVSTTVIRVYSCDKTGLLSDSILDYTGIEIRFYETPPNTPPPSGLAYVQTAIDYTVVPANRIVGVTDTSTTRTISLCDPATFPVGCLLTIKDETGAAGATPIIIDANDVDGATPVTIDSDFGSVTVYSDGAGKYYLASQI